MINIKDQEELLIAIGNALPKKIEVYAIGGTAMMLRGIKDSTLDIDLVFEKSAERELFIETALKLRAMRSDVTLVYGVKENTPEMLTFEDCRFDLFMKKIINSNFSDNMMERAKEVHEFGRNLVVKPADPQDILIMKSVTSRAKDSEDIATIINKVKIDWDIILREVTEQIKLGNERANLSLGEKLEDLNNRKVIHLPESVMDDLWRLLKKQVSDNKKRDKIKNQ